MWALLCLCRYFTLVACVASSECRSTNFEPHVRYFPNNFLFGTSTSAYQIEGAWNEDGKAESIWDRLVHTKPSVIEDQSTADEANDSYHLYKRDVEMLRELGVHCYRFSLAWTRILSTSFPDKLNHAGVEYYNNLINELLKYNIQPIVTIFHWDLPQKLQDMGGWTNPYIVEWYADYVRIVFRLFGDRVKYWITINEPDILCHFSYGVGYLAPRVNVKGVAEYICARHVLLAHAKAYHVYNDEFRKSQGGKIFISISSAWYEPESPEHVEAAEERLQFDIGHYAHAIFSATGDWPHIMKSKIAAKSAEQGYPRSRLPSFTQEEIDYIRGTADFFGLNHYTTYLVYRNASSNNYEVPSREDDIGVTTHSLEEWKYSPHNYLAPAPWGFKKLLLRIKTEYGNPPVIVTENGYSSHGGLVDDNRIKYYRLYLDALLDALDSGVDIRGYLAWTLMDNFEWIRGYIQCYGLYEVNRTSPERTRTPRKSAFVYKQIVRTRALDPHYEPDTTVMTIDQGH